MDKTWKVIDQQAMLRRMGNLPLTADHWIGCKIKASLTADCTQCVSDAASTVKSQLSNGAVKEVWRPLKGWYQAAEDHPPPACPETMTKQMAERLELYTRAPSMGTPLPFNFPHFEIPDGVPTDNKIREVVLGLKSGQAAGATGMRAEHVKMWLRDIWRREKVARENPSKTADTGELGKNGGSSSR